MSLPQFQIDFELNYVWNLVLIKSNGWPTITWDHPAARPHIKSLKESNDED